MLLEGGGFGGVRDLENGSVGKGKFRKAGWDGRVWLRVLRILNSGDVRGSRKVGGIRANSSQVESGQ